MNTDAFRQFLALLTQLREANIYHELAQHRDDALMIRVDVPGERWGIEFVDYGDTVQLEVERFTSDGHIGGPELLAELFARHADPKPERVSADG